MLAEPLKSVHRVASTSCSTLLFDRRPVASPRCGDPEGPADPRGRARVEVVTALPPSRDGHRSRVSSQAHPAPVRRPPRRSGTSPALAPMRTPRASLCSALEARPTSRRRRPRRCPVPPSAHPLPARHCPVFIASRAHAEPVLPLALAFGPTITPGRRRAGRCWVGVADARAVGVMLGADGSLSTPG